MISAKDILSHAIQQGVVLSLENGQLKYKAEKGKFTDELKELIKVNKQEIISYISKIEDKPTLNVLPPIKPRDSNQNLPLSYAQQRLWFISQLGNDSVQYNMPGQFFLQGELNLMAFERAFRTLLERHEVLRTNLKVIGDDTFQVINNDFQLPFKHYDLSDLSNSEKSRRISELNELQANTPFDLTRDVMIRMQVLNLTLDSHLVLYTMHHIASDGWSLGIFNKEFAQLYDAFASGEVNPLPELKIQYADYAVWQRNWLKDEQLETQLKYWRNQLADLPFTHQIPLDYPRPVQQSFLGRRKHSLLDQETTKSIYQACQENQVTLFMFLQTVFAVVLSRWSDSNDIVMGTPMSGRTHKDTEDMIGFFINTLVLRTELDKTNDFKQILKNNKEMILDAYAHQYIPFEMLVDELNPDRDLSINPLIQISFVVQNNETVSFELKEKDLSSVGESRGISNQERISIKYELALYVDERADKIALTWVYDDSIFEETTVKSLMLSFEILLKDILKCLCDAEQTEIDVTNLPLSEKLLEFEDNDLGSNHLNNASKVNTIVDLFDAQVSKRPNAIAVSLDNQQLSFFGLQRRSNVIAQYLHERGVKEDQIIGICVERSIDNLALIFAIWRIGAAYVAFDTKLPQKRKEQLILESDIAFLITHENLKEQFIYHNELSLSFIDSDEFKYLSEEWDLKKAISLNPERLAYVVYTSGSTGKPKGVMTKISSVVNYLSYLSNNFEIKTHDRILQLASLPFDASVRDLIGPVVNGAQTILVADKEHKDANLLINKLTKLSITAIFSIVPSFLKSLTYLNGVKNPIDKLRLILISGENLTSDLCLKAKQSFNPKIELVNQYGPTECTMTTTFHRFEEHEVKHNNVFIGKPIDGMKVFLLDKNYHPVPDGAVGEIFISGIGLAAGYLNNESLTNNSFINIDVSKSKTRLYRTGDLARKRDNNVLEFLGRADHQVKIRGNRVELEEIKNVIMKSDLVRESELLVIEDDSAGSQIVAYIIFTKSLEENHEASKDSNEQAVRLISDLKNYLQNLLPDYMLPSYIVNINEMPLLANGKVNRKRLMELEVVNHANSKPEDSPSTETEKQLLGIWSAVLKISAEKIGINDSFFDIGGHSLLAIIVVGQIKAELDLTIELASIFEHQTIFKLASYIDGLQSGKIDDLRRIERLDTIDKDSAGQDIEEFDL
ncbi:amino acid adenylation domain-containing protein [Aliikangiella marina]|uniref:Amino acid adenylation domain-containing protein n=1 Tax=Aliikangiella marina TaxID=1712262 RepID=A0A545TJI1_9GAMM|nr:non-ribosomal peptide synthetase [Aliikangiella marina]TQV77373.1 amino acid adenylation domain-containing protein [Aliikangiella marina]